MPRPSVNASFEHSPENQAQRRSAFAEQTASPLEMGHEVLYTVEKQYPIPMPVSPEKLQKLQEMMQRLGVHKNDLEEKFVRGSGKGDLYVSAQVEIPKKLTEKQKSLLREFEGTTSNSQYEKKKSFFDRLKDAFT